MDRELTPDEIRELLAAYAIDAVDDDERAAVDEYLAGDADARDEVVSIQRAAALLAHTGGPPPAGVWERLEAAIREAAGPDGTAPPPRLVPAGRPDPRPNRAWQWLSVAALVVALAFFSLWIVDRGSGSDPALDTAALARAAASAPGARHADLRDPDGNTVARAVVLRDGTGYLTSTKLQALDEDQTYQLWGVGDHGTISLGVIGSDPKVVAFQAGSTPTALAITSERSGGVPVSEHAPTAVGDLVV